MAGDLILILFINSYHHSALTFHLHADLIADLRYICTTTQS